jgi:hypothetical protein
MRVSHISAGRNNTIALSEAFGYRLIVYQRLRKPSEALGMFGRDKDATWRSLALLCRERGWSRSRAVYELQNGLPHRFVPALPPRVSIDWHDPDVELCLNVETGDLTLMRGVLFAEGQTCFVLGPDTLTVGIEVLPPTDAEMPSSPMDAPDALPSVRWARATTRNLRAENKVPKGTKKAGLARLLEAEAQKAVKAGQISRALKASYLEDQLVPWGIWPLSSLE